MNVVLPRARILLACCASILITMSALAGEAPRLFTPLAQVASKGTLHPAGVESVARVALDAKVFGFSTLTVSAEGHDYVIERFGSELAPDTSSEKFVYATGSDERLSTFTKLADGTVFGRLCVGGKEYFISPEGDHSLVVRSAQRPMAEVVHYPALMGAPLTIGKAFAGSTLTATSQCPGKCRAVRFPSPPPPPVIRVVAALENKYADAVGGKDMAIARATHWRDRQNTAYQKSGFEGRIEIVEFAFFDLPEDLSPWGTVFNWAIDAKNPVIRDMRRRNEAGMVQIFSTSTFVNHATRSSPDPAFLNFGMEIAVAGGFYASWSDDDIKNALHEGGGHTAGGGDHNIEDASPQAQDPQGSARDWYDCANGVRGALSYNRCDVFLEDAEQYSGENSFWNGKATGKAGVNDNVSMFRKVFALLEGRHP